MAQQGQLSTVQTKMSEHITNGVVDSMTNSLTTDGHYGTNRGGKVTVILGAMFGDEGKGKAVVMLAADADIVCRFQGGKNAGHTVNVDGVPFEFCLLPIGILYPKCICILGHGVVIHLPRFFIEVEELKTEVAKNWRDRFIISDKAHLSFDFHQQIDVIQNSHRVVRTTKNGIGPTYSSKSSRCGLRVADLVGDWNLFAEKFKKLVADQKQFYNITVDVAAELELYKGYAESIRPLVKETVGYLNKALKEGKKVMVEGANGALLDIDLGMYPYVTSSNTSIGGVCTGLGIPPSVIGETIAIVTAYCNRLGNGPFPTETRNEMLKSLAQRHEIHTGPPGAPYGFDAFGNQQMPRRVGWLDLALLKYSAIINGYTSIFLTKLDVLSTFPTIKVCVGYRLNGKEIDYVPSNTSELERLEPIYNEFEGWQKSIKDIRSFNKLPINAQIYVQFIEEFLDIPVNWIGVGPDKDSTITVY